ncbi:uncharacterized protein LOC144470813 [Augochlora pura]
MARITGHHGTRNVRKKKGRSRKPNIAMLVYQYLRLGPQPAESNSFLPQSPKRRRTVRKSLHPRVTNAKNMVKEHRKIYKSNEAPRIIKREKYPRYRRDDFEATNDMKRYIQKALNFGIEANYLIPTDDSGRVVRVTSNLANDGIYLRDAGSIDNTVSQDKERSPHRSPVQWADGDVQEPRSRRSRRKRRRSRSRRRRSRRRKRGRRRSRSDNAEYEVGEDDDYEFDNQPERKSSSETAAAAAKEKRNERATNESDGEKTIARKEEDGSDLSLDDDETDEDEKKGDDAANKS